MSVCLLDFVSVDYGSQYNHHGLKGQHCLCVVHDLARFKAMRGLIRVVKSPWDYPNARSGLPRGLMPLAVTLPSACRMISLGGMFEKSVELYRFDKKWIFWLDDPSRS